MAISNRAAITAGRAWAQERWDMMPARERPSLWPGTIREACLRSLLRDVSPRDDTESLTTAFVVLNAAELRWRELLGQETAAPGPSLFLSRQPGNDELPQGSLS
jgi:hypothetical protein